MLLNNDSNSLASNKDTNYLSDANNSLDSLFSNKKTWAFKSKDDRREYLEKRQLRILKILQTNDLALPGWKTAKQPWNEQICKKWISWGHILRHWEIAQHEKLAKEYRAPLKFCTHDKYRMKLIKAYKKFYNKNLNKETFIPYWLAAMVYAKVFLNRNVDWNIFDKKHNANKNIRSFQRDFVRRTQPPTDDAATIKPQVSPIHMTSSKDEDDLFLSERLAQIQAKGKRPLNPSKDEDDLFLSERLAQIQAKEKRPLNPSKDGKDRSISNDNFCRIRREPSGSIRNDEDEVHQEFVPPKYTIDPLGIQREIFGSPSHEGASIPQHPPHMVESSKAALNEATLTNISKLLTPTSKDHSADRIIVSAYLRGENEALNHHNRNLQKELEITCNEYKNQVDNITAELNQKNEENTILQARFSRVIQDFQKQNEENAVLQDLIPRLKEALLKEGIEKKRLYEKMEELKQTNEEKMVLQAQISRLKENLQREEKIKGENKLKIQELKEEIEKIKNEKRMIVQLDESQFDKITNLISHRVQGSDVAR